MRETTDKIVFLIVMAGIAASVMLCGCSNNLTNEEKTRDMYKKYKESFPDVPDVTVSELVDLMKNEGDKVVLVDIRETKEQEVSMIPGAITQNEFESDLENYKNKIIVPYCTIGYRSGLYAKKLRENGLNARNLEKSVIAWAEAGKDFVDGNGKPTRRVHVYGSKWNLLPEGYEGVF